MIISALLLFCVAASFRASLRPAGRKADYNRESSVWGRIFYFCQCWKLSASLLAPESGAQTPNPGIYATNEAPKSRHSHTRTYTGVRLYTHVHTSMYEEDIRKDSAPAERFVQDGGASPKHI